VDLDITEDQAVLLSGVENLLERYAEIPIADRRGYHYYASELDRALETSGFFETARAVGPLEAVLVTEAVSRLAPTVEVATSMLVAPHISEGDLPRPLCMISGDPLKAQRYLSVAKAALYDTGQEILLIELGPDDAESVESIFAYPYGSFRDARILDRGRSLGSGAVESLRQWQRVALATEASGAMRSAVDFTNDYVKQRQMFGHALGAFQVVQHRIAQCYQIACALQYLCYRAGWSQNPLDAMLAAVYAQQHISKVWFDMHQFNGAMGVTNEHKLHFWTYRLRALQAEMGGANHGALAVSDQLWGEAS
jgi:hypothetical protein